MRDSKTANHRPKISVVMVDGAFRDRYDSIDYMAQQTLPPNDFELIWVEYYNRIASDLAQRIARWPGFRTIALGHTGTYHSSYCFNRGIAEARGELIVIPDADVIVESDFLETVWNSHHENDRLVEYFHRYNEPQEQHQDTVHLKHLRRVCRITNPANHGACLSVRRKWLIEINGYDQNPIFATGFHANDMDVYTRLCNLGLLVRWSPTTRLYHPWHPMTGDVTPHYTPQHEVITWRGQTLSTLPFDGLEASRNTSMPERFRECAQWLQSLGQPRWQRAITKLRRLGGLEVPQSKAA